jgi:hypothetical protein
MSKDVRGKLEVIAHLGEHITYKEDMGIFYDSALAKVIEDAYIALKNGVTVQRWIPVTERLPDAEQIVQLSCRGHVSETYRYICIGFYVPHGVLREQSKFDWDYDCCDEYDEEHDDYIVTEGWYETIYNWDDYSSVGINDIVTHWMPLPTPPKEGE